MGKTVALRLNTTRLAASMSTEMMLLMRGTGGMTMKINDRINLLMLAAKDLKEAVDTYAKAVNDAPHGWVRAGINVPLHYSKEAIERRIVQMRQDLNILREELWE